MNTFSVREMIGFGWETFKKRPGFLVGATALLALVEIVLQTVGKVPFLGGLVSSVAGLFIGMYVIRFSLRAHDAVGEVSFSAAWSTQYFWRYVGASLLKGLIVAGPIVVGAIVVAVSAAAAGKPGTGFTLSAGFIIPALVLATLAIAWLVYASARLMFTEYFVIDAGKGPVESVKESFRASQWSVGKLVVLFFAIGLLNVLGAIALLVGLLVTIPVSLLTMVHAYRTLCPASAPVPSPTPTPVPPAPVS